MEFDINDPEVIKAIKDAGYLTKDDATAMTEETVLGLKSKNEELLKKLKSGKASQAELLEMQAQLEEIEQEKLRASEDWNALEKNLQGKMEKLQSKHSEQEAALTRAIMERDLTSELVKANVAPHYLEAAKAMHGSQVAYADGKTMVGDKPLSEFVSEWASSDDGKFFVAAPSNSGGGAPGGGKGSNGNAITREQFEQMQPRQQSDFLLKDGGKVVDE